MVIKMSKDRQKISEDAPDEDVILAWLQYWDQHGLELTIKSWCHYYKEYINEDFDISRWTKDIEDLKTEDPVGPVTVSASCKEEGEIVNEKSYKDPENQTGTKAWQEEWEKHCGLVYQEEYRNFLQTFSIPEVLEMPLELQNNPKLRKYWYQRYLLFSKFDFGIQLDEESWYSVTPEKIANHIAQKCHKVPGTIVDGFCGVGGNTIAFAKYFTRVIAIDIDTKKIEFARNNAVIYGVQDKIEFRVGDFMKIAPELEADVVFLSPPWGGPGYLKTDTFNLKHLKPCSGKKIFAAASRISQNIAFYVPRNVNRDQLSALAGPGNFVEIEENQFKGQVKAITAYYGNLIKTKKRKSSKANKEHMAQDNSEMHIPGT